MPSIPKFASFRPKSPPASASPASASVQEKHDKDRKRRHHHRRHRSGSRSKEGDNGRLLEVRESQPVAKDPASELFLVDLKGDPKNLVYGGNHRYDIPLFHRAGAGNVLGAPSDMRIDRDQSNDKILFLTRRGQSKFNSQERYVFSKIEKERPRLLKIKPRLEDDRGTEPEVDFISLRQRRHRQPKREDGSASEVDGEDYRSIHGKVKPSSHPVDEDLQFASDSETSGSGAGRLTDLDPSLTKRSIELSRQVEQSPDDVAGWLSLIEHQDALMNAGGHKRRITNAEMRSTAEIKLFMFEKALEKVKSLQDKERLLLGLMAEGSKIWEVQVQLEKWELISQENIQSVLLWKNYLDFRQTTFSTFRYEDVREIFLKRLNNLNEIIHYTESEAIEPLYHQVIYVLLRLTIYLRESGYSELPIAIWQGILEFNFFAPLPEKIGNNQAHKIALFKEFWESESPRVGETGALGWAHFVENADSSKFPDVVTDKISVVRQDQLFKSWAISENLRSKASRYPARTMDEVAEDDPFRVILMSDIEEYLIFLPINLHRILVDAFLLFCGLPASSDDVRVRLWAMDSFILGSSLDPAANKFASVNTPTSSPEAAVYKQPDITSIFSTYPAMFAVSQESMFGTSWFRSSLSWQEQYGGDNGPVAYNWLRAILSQLVNLRLHQEFAEYYLAFEWRNEPSTVKKVAKSLLKSHSSSLQLYNAYGLIEWANGKREVATGVFSAALGIGKTMSQDGESDTIIIWQSWLWKVLDAGENLTALKLLLSVADGTPNENITLSPALLLKARQFFSSHRDNSHSNGNDRYAIVYAELLAILQYLTSTSRSETQSSTQGDITTALSIYTKFSQVIQDRNHGSSTFHELLLQSATRLLYLHSRSGPFRPALLRQYLTSFLSFFPQNTIFLSLYTFNESRLRIENRVRTILHSTILTSENDNLVSRLFSINFELSHGTIHAARSAFEHATLSPACKSSISLWKIYIMFCAKHFQHQVKDVWYSALRACPWAKDLYILGFGNLAQLMEYEELKGTWKVMGEKDLRVHVDLEDIFDEVVDLNQQEKLKVSKLGFK